MLNCTINYINRQLPGRQRLGELHIIHFASSTRLKILWGCGKWLNLNDTMANIAAKGFLGTWVLHLLLMRSVVAGKWYGGLQTTNVIHNNVSVQNDNIYHCIRRHNLVCYPRKERNVQCQLRVPRFHDNMVNGPMYGPDRTLTAHGYFGNTPRTTMMRSMRTSCWLVDATWYHVKSINQSVLSFFSIRWTATAKMSQVYLTSLLHEPSQRGYFPRANAFHTWFCFLNLIMIVKYEVPL